MDALLEQAGVDDRSVLSVTDLDALLQQLDAGRPRLLSFLKELGVQPLGARQRIANALGRYVRTGSFVARGESSAAERYLYNEGHFDDLRRSPAVMQIWGKTHGCKN